MSLEDKWRELEATMPPAASAESRIAAKAFYLAGATAVLELLHAVPEARDLPSRIWMLDNEQAGLESDLAERAFRTLSPADAFAAHMRDATRRGNDGA